MHPDQVTIVRGAAKAERVYVLLGGEQAQLQPCGRNWGLGASRSSPCRQLIR